MTIDGFFQIPIQGEDMRFVAGGVNGVYLREIAENAVRNAESVRAAVAYVGRVDEFFEVCYQNNVKLTLWGRYDWSCPVEPRVLRWFLDKKSPNFSCRLVPDMFHPKVIWWENYGVYIGSANLTGRAWNSNIEAGTFFYEEELDSIFEKELLHFFDEVDMRSHPLTEEIYTEALEQTKKATTQPKTNERHSRAAGFSQKEKGWTTAQRTTHILNVEQISCRSGTKLSKICATSQSELLMMNTGRAGFLQLSPLEYKVINFSMPTTTVK